MVHRRRQWHPTPVHLPGKSHGQRSLVGCSPRGREELDTTERLYFHFSLAFIGEGNGNPLQCSCLENPRDGRAWWAAVYGVTKSRKQLSSSSSSAFICTKVLSTLPSAPGPSTDRATSSLSSRSLRVSYKTNKFLPCYCPPLKA